MGITQVLPQLMREDFAKELMMTSRMFDAETAQAVGLITRIAASPLQSAQDLAVELFGQSPEAVNGSRALIDQTWSLPPGEGLAIEVDMQDNIMGSPDQIESVMARLAKRPLKFV